MITVPHTLKNFNLFVAKAGSNASQYAGLVTELNLPKLTLKTEEYRAAGMDAPIPVEVGMEAISCDFTLAEYRKDILDFFGFFDYDTTVTFRGAFDDGKNDPIATEVKVNGLVKETDFGSWKLGNLTTFKASFVATYYQLSFNGEEAIEIDLFNMVRKINGVDQLAKCKNIISN
jgi:uncharacterized protein